VGVMAVKSAGGLASVAVRHEPGGWPLHDIVVTNIVLYMAYTNEVEGGSYVA